MNTGRSQTLAFLREKVWVTNGKSLIRSVLRNCSYCKGMNTKPKLPLGELPRQRLSIGLPAFTNTGIDYFGPLTIKQSKQTRKTSATAKCYEAVFTCLTTRAAVHLELIGNLSTDNFILGFRRFILRRGFPVKIISDNGTNFIGGD